MNSKKEQRNEKNKYIIIIYINKNETFIINK